MNDDADDDADDGDFARDILENMPSEGSAKNDDDDEYDCDAEIGRV